MGRTDGSKGSEGNEKGKVGKIKQKMHVFTSVVKCCMRTRMIQRYLSGSRTVKSLHSLDLRYVGVLTFGG